MIALFHARLKHSKGLLLYYRPQAERLLIQPQRIGKVGELYREPTTGHVRARVYWKIGPDWYAVNVPLGHLEPC